MPPMRMGTWVRALALFGLACGGDDGPGDLDAGGGFDAGGEVDAGSFDAGGGFDAGGEVDAGGGVDAGGADADGGVDAGGSDAGPVLPDYDAGNPFGDAGTLGEPEWVDIDVLIDGSTCEPLVACGGDEVGTWDVTGGCVEVPLPAEVDEISSRCPGFSLTSTGRARGRVVFDGTIAQRVAQSEATVEAFVPAICAAVAGGCDAIEGRIAMADAETACVQDRRRNCRCAIRRVNVIDDGDGYAIEGNQIVSATLMKRWDYCVSGTELRYRDVSSSGEREPGIIELGRR